MKGVLLALLVIVAVLFVTVESIKGPKRGKGRVCRNCLKCTESGTCIDCKVGFKLNQDTDQCEKDCGKNCVRCDGRRCVECDDEFSRITFMLRRFNKTVCKPCTKPNSLKRKGVDVDRSKCAAVNATKAPCSKRCAKCIDGICQKCAKGFALVSRPKHGDFKFCIPCAKTGKPLRKFENADKSRCPEKKKNKKGGKKNSKNKGGKRKSKATPSPDPAP